MSDFIYSAAGIPEEDLGAEIRACYREDPPKIHSFQGSWGTLAVSQNLYQGFEPVETDKYLLVVLGGPQLQFTYNDFLSGKDATAGTRKLLERWQDGLLNWQSNLSGPFCVVLIDKASQEVSCVTDLLSFIPVYQTQREGAVLLSSHLDALARVSLRRDQPDLVSQADFILHKVVTYPYTSYEGISQLSPGSVHRLKGKGGAVNSKTYWLPREQEMLEDIEAAAAHFRKSVERYIIALTQGMKRVAQFISGGEDSRALAGMLPKEMQRDGFVFLDGMNREGQLARRAAEAYGVRFQMGTRKETHYLDLLPGASDLVGRGSLYLGLHSYGFHKSCGLRDYPAVFGGLYADALFKGSRIKKERWSSRYRFLRQRKDMDYSVSAPIKQQVFRAEIVEQVQERRRQHLERIQEFRGESAEEWFQLWPASMNLNIPNLHGNRRLFRSYEPFLCHELVQLSARMPQAWKLNRRFFTKAVRPYLKPTKWLLHGDGRLPYFSWKINSMLSLKTFLVRKIRRRLGFNNQNDEPWADWNALLNSEAWQEKLEKYSPGFEALRPILREQELRKLISDGGLDRFSKFALLQELYYASRKGEQMNWEPEDRQELRQSG